MSTSTRPTRPTTTPSWALPADRPDRTRSEQRKQVESVGARPERSPAGHRRTPWSYSSSGGTSLRAGDGNRTRMTSLEGFGSGDAGQPGRRSSNVASCPRVTVIAPVSPADRARSGHASVEVAYYGLTAAPWSSSSPSELRITSVSRCLATGVGTPPTLRFAGCSCWRLLVVHGPSGAPRGHAFATCAIRSLPPLPPPRRQPWWLPCRHG